MKDFFEHLRHEFELPLENPVLIFSLILFIILLSPILLRKLNIPGIIGLIISGVVIGPFGLKYGINENIGKSFQIQVKREFIYKLIGFLILYFQNPTN